MDAEDTRFSDAEVELRQLIDDVTRAMARAQAAIARVTNKSAPDAMARDASGTPAPETRASETLASETLAPQKSAAA